MTQYKIICPLFSFQIPCVLIGHPEMSPEEVKSFFKELRRKLVEGFDLIDGVKVRRISKEDVEDLKSWLFPLPSEIRLSPNMFVLVKYSDKEERDFETAQIMQNILLALRLLKGGYVSASYVFYIDASKRSLTQWSWNEERRRETWGQGYALDVEEIPVLQKLLRKIWNTNFAKQRRLDLACKRFQRGYEEVDPKDQLIDLMIAYEALFVRTEIAGSSQKQKIANGCADLLGRSKREKEEIRRFMLKARSMRDLIVHGAEHKVEDIEDFILKLEDYLRESIKIFLG